MTRSFSLGVLSFLVAAGVAVVGCGSTSSGNNTTSTSGSPSGSGGGGVGGGDVGGGVNTGGGDTGGGSSPSGTSSTATGTGGGAPAGSLCPFSIFDPTPGGKWQKVQDASISVTTHWDSGQVWLVQQTVEFDAAGDGAAAPELIIEEGTTVCFASGAQLRIGPSHGAKVTITGSAGKPVIFTAEAGDGGLPSYWSGLEINNFDPASQFKYLNILYAGPGGGGATPALAVAATSAGKLLLDHVTVDQVQSKGLSFLGPDGLDSASKVTFNGYAPTVPGSPPLLQAVEADIVASGTLSPSVLTLNTANIPADSAYIKIIPSPGEALYESVSWVDLGLPYRISDIAIYGDTDPANLTINEGVTVQPTGSFTLGNPDLAGEYGNIIVKGTAAKPVRFTSAESTPAKGDWGTFYFLDQGFDPAVSSFDNAIIEYGGTSTLTVFSDTDDSNGNGLIEVSASGCFAGPKMTNTTLQHSASDGVRVNYGPTAGDYLTTDYSGLTYNDITGTKYPPAPPANACP